MNENNKSELALFAKKLAIIVYALLTIITCAGVWNFCPEDTVKVLAGVLFACNGLVVVRLWKKSEDKPSA